MDTNMRLVSLIVLLSLGCYVNDVIGEETTKPTNVTSSTTPAPNGTTKAPETIAPETKAPKVPTTPAGPKLLKAVTLLDPPFVMMTPRGDQYTGLVVDVLMEAIKDLGYDEIKWSIPNEAKFGYEERPGQWNGLIGAVQNKSAEIAVAAFSMSSARSTVVEFSQPFMHAGFRVLYTIPDSWHPGEAMATMVRPFTPGLWVLIVFMFIIASAGLYVIGRFSPYEDIAFVGKTATYEGLNFTNSMLYVFSSLTWQGYTAAPKSISGRVLTSVWWVFCLFTVGAYIAGLCVVLFRVNPEIRTLPFVTLDEMSRQKDVGVMIVNGSSTHRYLNSTKAKLESRIFAAIKLREKELIVSSTKEAIDKMAQSDGKLALLMDGPAAEYITTQEPCDKMVIGEPLGDHTYGFACQIDSNLCQNMSTRILAMKESGHISLLRDKWLRGGCLEDKPNTYVYEGLPFFDTFGGEPDAIMPMTITVSRFSSAFIIFIIGVILAAVVLVLEIVFARRRGTAVPRKLERAGMDDDTERIDNEFHDDRT